MLVIRITFKSGAVREERGTADQVQAMFDEDRDGLIDYVTTLDPVLGLNDFWCHDADEPDWAWLDSLYLF